MIRSLNFLESSLRTPRVVIALALSILAIYLAPLFIYGENLSFQMFDNLDSNIVWFKVLAESGMMFADSNAIIPNMMGGLPRHTFGSELNVELWLFYFFPPFTAYIINEVLMHTVAFGAMWVLLSRYFIVPTRGNTIFIAIGSLYFALLPYWPGGGLSIPAMPLVMYALLNIRNGISKWHDWTILVLVPLYSCFVIIYFFFLLAAGFFWLVDSIRKRDWQWPFIGAIVMITILYLGVEYRLVYSTFFDHSFVSHRSEFESMFTKSMMESYRDGLFNFLNGHPLAKGNHFLIVLPLSFTALILLLRGSRFNRHETFIILIMIGLGYLIGFWNLLFTSKYFFPVAAFFLIWYWIKVNSDDLRLAKGILLLMVISLWGGFWFYTGWKEVQVHFPFLQMFNMSRFAFLQPFIWSLVAVFTFMILGKRLYYYRILLFFIFGGLGYIGIHNATFMISNNHQSTYKTYYAVEQFSELKHYIGLPLQSYRVASLGIDPAVAIYNGLYTIDGYSVNYPLEYKHRFKKIIIKELEKNRYTNAIFDTWGSKCYVLTRAVSYNGPNKPENFQNIELDTDAMVELGTRYLISSEKIPDPQSGFRFLKQFSASGAYRTLYLYEIKLK